MILVITRVTTEIVCIDIRSTSSSTRQRVWGCSECRPTLIFRPKDFCRAIVRKITHRNPHVSLQALTVLDSCVNNCGVDFKKEVASQVGVNKLGFEQKPADIIVVQTLRFQFQSWLQVLSSI